MLKSGLIWSLINRRKMLYKLLEKKSILESSKMTANIKHLGDDSYDKWGCLKGP